MAIHVSPAAFATGTKPGKAALSPVLAASGTKPGAVSIHPILMASGTKPPKVRTGLLLLATASEEEIPIRVDCRADTLRDVSRAMGLRFDSLRDVRKDIPVRLTADAARDIVRSLRLCSDAARDVRRRESLAFDTLRNVRGEAHDVALRLDTRRVVREYSLVSASFDTRRIIPETVLVSASFDTRRIIPETVLVSTSFDTRRIIPETVLVSTSFDTRRMVRTSARISASFDTRRIVQRLVRVLVSFDTRREIVRRIAARFAAVRAIPHVLGDGRGCGVQSMTLTLAENTLSDTFQMVTTVPIGPKDMMMGTLLDFPYCFKAEETRKEGILYTVKRSMYDADRTLYTPLKYSLAGLPSKPYDSLSGAEASAVHASGHAEMIAAALGTEAVFLCDDFVPRENYAGTETTYQSVLAGIFGWSKNVPRKLINVFLRGDRLYFLQRGHETGTIHLSDYPWYSLPVIEQRVMRTTWGQAAEATNPDLPTFVKSGRMYWIDGDDKAPTPSDDGVETAYENVDSGGGRADSRIRYTIRQNPDGTTTRADYEYIDTGTDYLLRQITEVTTFPSGEVYKTRVTRYTYTPDGWRHMVVTENNEVVEESEEATGGSSDSGESSVNTGSAAWRGCPGDRGNEHTDEQVRLSHGAKWKKAGSSGGSSFLPEVARDIPVLDRATCRTYLEELEWMDRRVEEKAMLTITAPVRQGVVDPAGSHVMDFFDLYYLDGRKYYLVSNVVSLTPRSLKQSLTLVRWHG